MLLIGQSSGLAREGMVDDDDDSSDDEANDSAPTAASSSARDIFSVSAALESYDEMVQMADVNADASSERNAPILTPNMLQEQNKKALQNDPNSSGERKLRQLERLQ